MQNYRKYMKQQSTLRRNIRLCYVTQSFFLFCVDIVLNFATRNKHTAFRESQSAYGCALNPAKFARLKSSGSQKHSGSKI